MLDLNRDRLLEVADAIEQYSEHFNMGTFWDAGYNHIFGTPPECGTKACIAGWAATLAGYRTNLGRYETVDFEDKGAQALGLTYSQARRMFLSAEWIGLDVSTIADRLRAIAKDELVWDKDASNENDEEWDLLKGNWVPA